jgi:hypothetical protein
MGDSNDGFVSWMIAGGARLDQPDPRNLAHLVALRDAQREDRRASPFAWLVERLGVATQTRAATDPMTQCCTA